MVRDLTGGYLLFSPHSKNSIVYKWNKHATQWKVSWINSSILSFYFWISQSKIDSPALVFLSPKRTDAYFPFFQRYFKLNIVWTLCLTLPIWNFKEHNTHSMFAIFKFCSRYQIIFCFHRANVLLGKRGDHSKRDT